MIHLRNQCVTLSAVAAILWAGFAPGVSAQVERYKDEALYLARLVELGYAAVQEDFEGAIWDPLHSNYPDNHWAASLTHQRIQYRSAGRDLWTWPGTPALISVNQNWARGGEWGIYDNYLASTLRIVTPEPIYGIGFWVNTNPDGQDVGVLFTERTTANGFGYVLPGYGAMYPGDIHPFGHGFVGFVDPAGFTNVVVTGTLEVNEENQLEGGTVYGADDFTFGVQPSFILDPHTTWLADRFLPADLGDPAKEATVWGSTADPDLDRVDNWHEYLFGGDPNVADASLTAVAPERLVDPTGTHLRFTFRRRIDDARLAFVPEATSDAHVWPGVLNVAEVDVMPIDSSLERVTCEVPTHPSPSGVTLGRIRVEHDATRQMKRR